MTIVELFRCFYEEVLIPYVEANYDNEFSNGPDTIVAVTDHFREMIRRLDVTHNKGAEREVPYILLKQRAFYNARLKWCGPDAELNDPSNGWSGTHFISDYMGNYQIEWALLWIRGMENLCKTGFLRPIVIRGQLGYEFTTKAVDKISNAMEEVMEFQGGL